LHSEIRAKQKREEVMKRFFILLSILFCSIAVADTITINWGVDNQPYTTTTCEIGGDVILPSVSKRGHIFRGWQAEHFYRGTFENYNAIPNTTLSYTQDTHGNYTPLVGDYIILENVYDCQNNISFKARFENNIPYLDVLYQDYWYSYNMKNYLDSVSRLFIAGNNLSVYMDTNYWIYHFYTETNGVMYNYNNYSNGDNFLDLHYRDGGTRNVFINCQYSGSWRFKYDGVWATDGKNGWKQDQQIVSE
jgi:hypothetical protein